MLTVNYYHSLMTVIAVETSATLLNHLKKYYFKYQQYIDISKLFDMLGKHLANPNLQGWACPFGATVDSTWRLRGRGPAPHGDIKGSLEADKNTSILRLR